MSLDQPKRRTVEGRTAWICFKPDGEPHLPSIRANYDNAMYACFGNRWHPQPKDDWWQHNLDLGWTCREISLDTGHVIRLREALIALRANAVLFNSEGDAMWRAIRDQVDEALALSGPSSTVAVSSVAAEVPTGYRLAQQIDAALHAAIDIAEKGSSLHNLLEKVHGDAHAFAYELKHPESSAIQTREPDAPDGGGDGVALVNALMAAQAAFTKAGSEIGGKEWDVRAKARAALLAALRRATPRDGGTASFDRVVVAISGGLGAGKGSLAAALAERMDAARVSFGVEVRRAVAEMGADPSDMERLQTVGQAIVVTDCDGLIDRTLAQATGPVDRPIIISGLRHVEVWCELRRRFPMIRLVHVDTPDDVRAARLMERDGIERRLTARFDNALSEVQLSRILPQYATARLNGSLPVDLQADYAATFLNLDRRDRLATEHGEG